MKLHISPKDCVFSDNKQLLQIDRVMSLLSGTYWGKDRTRETVTCAIEHSLCFGAYYKTMQIGFARVVTDYATMYYLCDVVIDEEFRGLGIGRTLMGTINENEQLRPLLSFLITRDAHEFYRSFSYVDGGSAFMIRRKTP